MNPVETQPASRLLAEELSRKVRERGIVVWLDAEERYAELADRLREGFAFKYPVVTLRGSYLELMFGLRGFGNGRSPEHVLVHLPGLNNESIKETPVLELYKAGTVFQKKLETLVREAAVGVARPEEVERFLRETEPLTLSATDAWLESLRTAPREGIAVYVDHVGIDDVVTDVLTQRPRLTKHLPDGDEQLFRYLEKHLGLSRAWRDFVIPQAELNPHNAALLLASWLMAVEFVTDLREPPVTPELQPLTRLGPLAKECHRLLARLRQQDPRTYEELGSDVQRLFAEERTSHHAAALGSIDTFRFEEAAIRAAAIGALQRGDWAAAQALAKERTPERCFWVQQSPPLQRTWELLRLGAELGVGLISTKEALAGSASLEEAVERYVEKLAPLDRAHRILEQRAHAQLKSDLGDYDALLEVRTAVRRAYRDWADASNRRFFELCKRRGVLPGRSLRQRAIYEDVVQPLLDQGGKVAFFLVDALRFEMAQALHDELRKDKVPVSLTARLAELPTLTEVGMNALAPVARDGRLEPVIKDGALKGFRAGEFTVNSPGARIRAMSQRSLQGTAEELELEEIQELNLTQLKRRLSGKPPLIVVRSRELDTAGEHGLHLGTFDQSLSLIKSALSLLQQAGVDRFVIASDHGFLLQDPTAASVPFGASKRVPGRRHVLSTEPSGMSDVLELRLSELEYDLGSRAPEELYLVLRADTAVWETAEKIPPFVHGGNSLQERVIPVLIVERQGARGRTTSKYEVVAKAEPGPLGRQKLRLAVRLQARETATLGFAVPKHITLALRVPGRPEVTVILLGVTPPAELADGRLAVPPNKEEATVEFTLEGPDPGKVRIEIYHPDAKEEVTPKTVEEFFEVVRDPRRGKAPGAGSVPPPDGSAPAAGGMPPPPVGPATAPTGPVPPAQDWRATIEDEGFAKVLGILEQRRSINEAELQTVLGSPRRVRAFARAFDELVRRLPFAVEVGSANGLKTYSRKD